MVVSALEMASHVVVPPNTGDTMSVYGMCQSFVDCKCSLTGGEMTEPMLALFTTIASRQAIIASKIAQ